VLEILIELLFELLAQVVVEFTVTLGWESLGHALRSTRKANPVLALLGWAIIGAGCGALSAVLFPQRLLPQSRVPGVSLVVAPLVTGSLMKMVGDRRREAGKDATILATFWGGAVFAFTLSMARALLVRTS
jgi:hypothetical protein